MNWNNTKRDIRQDHAFLSPSKYHWINYSEDKLVETYLNYKRTVLGTRYHAIAAELINLAVRLPSSGASLNSFVNDAIGFKMRTEQLLYYSPNCFGTTDAISFNDGVLRIHDLKTGVSPGSITQLIIYAALFCLDYRETPKQIHLRIYQNDEVTEYDPPYHEIEDVMERIERLDAILNEADLLTAL